MKPFHHFARWGRTKTLLGKRGVVAACLVLLAGCSDPYARSARPSHPAAPRTPAPGCPQYKPVCVGTEEHCEFDHRGCEVCTCNATERNPGPWQPAPESAPH